MNRLPDDALLQLFRLVGENWWLIAALLSLILGDRAGVLQRLIRGVAITGAKRRVETDEYKTVNGNGNGTLMLRSTLVNIESLSAQVIRMQRQLDEHEEDYSRMFTQALATATAANVYTDGSIERVRSELRSEWMTEIGELKRLLEERLPPPPPTRSKRKRNPLQ